VWTWAAALGAVVFGYWWMRKRTTQPPTPAGGQSGPPPFTQQQEVSDFQIFSSLTGAQQASDLNFLSEVAGLFAGGQSPTSNTPGGTGTAPPSTGTAPPSTTPAASSSTATPGYGTVQTAQGQMVWLGVDNPGSPIYNVGGGAPVYFGNTQTLAQGPPSAGNEDIYTPVGYAGLVAGQTAPWQGV